jgi:hypothetical protein
MLIGANLDQGRAGNREIVSGPGANKDIGALNEPSFLCLQFRNRFAPHSLPPFACIRLRCPVAFAIDYGFTSSPYDGWLKVPKILMGTISPASFFLNNSSTDLRRTDFTPFDPFESFLSTCKVP